LTQVEAEKFTKGLIVQRLSSVNRNTAAGKVVQLYTFNGVPFAEGSTHVEVGSVNVLEVVPFACDDDFMIIGNLRFFADSDTAQIESEEMGYGSFAELIAHLETTPIGVPFIGKPIRFDMGTLSIV